MDVAILLYTIFDKELQSCILVSRYFLNHLQKNKSTHFYPICVQLSQD